MHLQFGDVRLLVSDFGASFRFYRDTLGLPLQWGEESGGYAQFKLDGLTLALLPRDDMGAVLGAPVGPSGSSSTMLSFVVADVDAAYADLLARGAAAAAAPQDRADWGYRIAHIQDPDGNFIELYQELR